MSTLRSLKNVPPVRWLNRLRYDRAVRRDRAWWFWGAFDSYDEAVAAAPARGDKGVGYDTPGMAELGRDVYERMHPFDYPALFWLDRFLGRSGDAPSVVDLGGHLGEKYRVFRRYVHVPSDTTWRVCETRDVVDSAAGRVDLAAPGLDFTTDRACLDGADVLFASGSLQYLETPLPDILAGLRSRPRHLVVNKVPLADGPDVWTLQNAGRAIVPYHVMNREAFLGGLEALGYRTLDVWAVPERRVAIPFHESLGTDGNAGCALELTG